MLFVLTTLMKSGKQPAEWRPVGVVDESQKHIADQWAAESNNNDWIPLEMNDLSLTGLSDAPTTFKPKPPTPLETQAEQSAKSLEKTNATLIGIIEELARRHKDTSVLKVIEGLKAEGKIAAGPAYAYERSRRPMAHVPGCPVFTSNENPEQDFMGKCDCKDDRLGGGGLRGCKDCLCLFDEPHRPYCPRIAQQTLFGSKSAAKYEDLEPGMRVWFDGNPEVSGTIVRVWQRNKENPQHSIVTVEWQDKERYGKLDIPVHRLLTEQKSLFASRRYMQDVPDEFEVIRKLVMDRTMRRHTSDCTLRATGKCSCKTPCSGCGARFDVGKNSVLDEPHKADCPFMQQQPMFASELLKKR